MKSQLKSLLILQLLLAILIPSISYAIESAQNFIQKAHQSEKSGEFKTALIHLKNAALKHPKNKQVKLALAELYIQIGFGPQAAIELDKATYLGAKKNETQLLKIKSKLIQGKFVDVTSQISDILNVNTQDIGRIRALQGQAYLNQGNVEKARSFFLRGSRLAPDSLEVKIGLARLYTIDKKNDEAKAIIQSLYKSYPYNSNILLLAGNMYREEQKYKLSREVYQQAIEIQPGNTAARLGIITAYLGEREFEKADIAVGKLLDVDAEHETGNHLQAVIAYELKNYTKALQAIKVIEKNNRNNKGILLVSGSVYYQLGKYDIAEAHLREFLKVRSNDLGARKMLANVAILNRTHNLK
ncbi:tetratricopeptide repeat protein [sulfur-oxidizing endosymbiont of Gigantopelta aegis]|uniref:tetratricopeptide repeat protein n=1 Tax=sulfur-oxidizing endosymbiont of Gigantopelta aegis TaxID=2794934 RepID=UPI0018DB5F04|nr:tetratricopeptide repeat protein [sulfur-oxidizing endosymbiont of Gigantopelta aegis]